MKLGRPLLLGLGLILAIVVISCGGGGNNNLPPPTVTVTISPKSATVTAGNQKPFAVTVTGSSNMAVTWSVSPTAGGTISSSGLYTAPNTLPTTNPVTVTVTSQADATKSDSAMVTITAAPPPIVKQTVTVTANNPTPGVNITVQSLTPTLQLDAVGTGTSGGASAVQVKQGTSASLFIVGNGIVYPTFYQISGPNDIQVTQPASTDFSCRTTTGMPCVNVSISVGSSAALGPRNILVTNSAGELSVFVGGLVVTQ